MKSENFVVSGDYKGKDVISSGSMAVINIYFFKSAPINKRFAEGYEIIGQPGNGKYHVRISFKDGKESVLEVKDEVMSAIEAAFR